MPLCSVIIPAYNAESFISACVESALAQDVDTEVIVVNDGSVDGTEKSLEPYLSRIVYLEQPNAGPASARNAAIEKATGEYIALLDADDIWLPGRLRLMMSFLEANPQFGFATSDSYLTYEETETSETYYRKLPSSQRFQPSDQKRWIVRSNFVFVMTLIRRRLFDAHGMFDESLVGTEDWDLWIRFLMSGESVGLVAEPLARYRVHQGSVSSDIENRWANEVKVLEKARKASPALPGIAGCIRLARAKLAFVREDYDEARALFGVIRADGDLEMSIRVKAGIAAMFPSLAGRLYVRRLGLVESDEGSWIRHKD